MTDPITALFARDIGSTLALSARPDAPVREERMRGGSRRRGLRLRIRRDRA